MRSSGFTLVELLAVIIVLSLLSLLASTAITKLVTDSKNDLYETQILSIEAAAKEWGSDNLNRLPDAGNCAYITLHDLKVDGLINPNVLDPRTNEAISDDLKIKIISNVSKYGTLNFNYEVNPVNVDGCEYIYKPICSSVTEATKTTGNVPVGLYNPGDEYICQVNKVDSYHFFILGVDGERVKLIMDRNINSNGEPETESNKGLVAWINNLDFVNVSHEEWNSDNQGVTVGPITALKYLKQATKSWTNIPSLDQIYINTGKDIGGYNTVNISGKSRLPSSVEMNEVGCTESNVGCPLWASNYISEYNQDGIAQEMINKFQSIQGISGYWTLDTTGTQNGKKGAWYLQYGTLYYESGVDTENELGVRPVIELMKSNLS